jgi:hypothetical protein
MLIIVVEVYFAAQSFRTSGREILSSIRSLSGELPRLYILVKILGGRLQKVYI